MDKDYKDFVERMGSFEDTIDLADDEIVNKTLKHFGIPGMHWGHKNGNTIKNVKWTSSDGSSNFPFKMNSNVIGAASRTGQSAAQLGQTVNKTGHSGKALKEAKALSDDDLKKLTARLNLENNYMNAKSQQSGKGRVESILSTSAAALGVVSSAAVMVDLIKKARG